MQDYTLTNILNRVQVLSTRFVYNYNKMERINSKPALQAGNEELTEYNVNLQLHANFCNPKEIIDFIKEKAASREPFEWMYHDEYMGSYLIDSVEVNRQKMIQGFILYAELNINLLENPEVNNKEEVPKISEDEQFSESSNKFKAFSKKAKEAVKSNIKNAVDNIISGNATISENLSDAAKELFNQISLDVIGDVSGKNITEMYGKVSGWVNRIENNSSITPAEIITLSNAVRSIPKTVIKTGLRGG